MLASEEEFSDLLIFKRRGIAPAATQPEQKPQPAPLQAATQQAGAQAQPKQASKPQKTAQKPVQRTAIINTQPEPEPQYAAKATEEKDKGSKQKQFCISHPWRAAYGTCYVCKLPYCYADLIIHNKKMYCLNDIDDVLVKEGLGTSAKSVMNSFSLIAATLLIANSAVLIFYLHIQLQFILQQALAQGIYPFILHLKAAYTFPMLNLLVIIFGLLSAVAVTRRSISPFVFAFLFTFVSLFFVIYEYLLSPADYLIFSSVIMLLTLSSIMYSRISMAKESYSSMLNSPDVEWPKPEVF